MALMSCGECSAEISDKAAACPKCGAPLRAPTAPQPVILARQHSRTVAIVLALFLGGFGAHKFYLGSPGLGIVYLLFCWTFIPAIIAFIEALSYLFMGESAFNTRFSGTR